MSLRIGVALSLLCLVGAELSAKRAFAQDPEVSQAVRYGLSLPLAQIVATPRIPRVSLAPYKVPNQFSDFSTNSPDAVTENVQEVNGPTPIGSVLLEFDGASDDDNLDVLGYRIVPPDTQGDVGPNHYFQWINSVATIFGKDGTTLLGPFAGNLFFAGLGGPCETTNNGDPIVLYDHLADRWLASQFSISTAPYAICIAISATADPLGAYYQYEFSFGDEWPDYFKVGVWEDAYYISARMYVHGNTGTGMKAIAVERAQMLSGGPAQMVLFNLPNIFDDGVLPADLDGPTPPPGTPGIFAGTAGSGLSNEIEMWEFDVDWVTPAGSSFTSTPTLTGAAVSTGLAYVQQPVEQALDHLWWLTMHRAQFRKFEDYQTLLLNHTADVGSGRAGIRWYELRRTDGPWSIYQQGTYGPDDGENRWMGSIAMNGLGDIALGYSVSSSTTHPSIRFTGQTADQSGTGLMNMAEEEIIAGSGSQLNSFRWGDYSMMAVDPSDDTTFWYTSEYYTVTTWDDFKTRIAQLIVDTGLPVELTSFSVKTESNTVLLEWETASELNNLGFDIQHRHSEIVDTWQDMAFVQGIGATSIPGSYSYRITDLDPGYHSFRLKQIDFDGSYKHSEVLEASIAPNNGYYLTTAYPNPFNPSSRFTLMVTDDQRVRIDVSNALGQMVEVVHDGLLAGGRTHTFTINGSGLPSGVYLYRVQGTTFVETQTVTLMK